MKQSGRKVLGIAAAAVLLGSVAAGVSARGYGYGPFFGPGYGGHHAMMGGYGTMHGAGPLAGPDALAFTGERLARIKDALGITPQQEGAWNAYARAVQDNAEGMTHHWQGRFDATGPQAGVTSHREHLERMDAVVDAGRDLHAALTPEQQKRARGLLGPGCATW